MKTPQQIIVEQATKKILGKAFEESDPWEYNLNTPMPGVSVSGTNGVEASADEVASGLGDLKEPGEWHRIGDEIKADVVAGVPLKTAKQRAALRAMERRNLPLDKPVPIPGDNDGRTLTGIPLPATPDELMEVPVEHWSNHDVGVVHKDVGVVHKEAIRAGYGTPKGRDMAEKVKSWYGHHVKRRMAGPDASGAASSSGGGPVHVDAYSRTQGGKSLSVRSHTRSRPQ